MALLNRFRRFDPTAYGFPKPHVPLLPQPNIFLPLLRKGMEYQSIDEARNFIFYARGRYALFEAYKQAGIGANASILMPAYHCRTMVDPAVRLGADILFYHQSESLVPDLHHIRFLVDSAPSPVAALLLPHYFGFPQPIEAIAELCRQRSIMLIEDCSHAYFKRYGGRDIAGQGNYIVASPYKFIAAQEGGILMMPVDQINALPIIKNPSWASELGEGLHWIREILTKKRFNSCSLETNPRISDREVQYVEEPGLSISRMYNPDEEGRGGLRLSKWLISHIDPDEIAKSRRANYQQWLDAVARLPQCSPLFPTLPIGVVPYMFPLLIDLPDPHFFILKSLGVPIWRWDEMAVSDCPVATSYSASLLHLPCHQTLSRKEMSWMISVISSVLNGTT